MAYLGAGNVERVNLPYSVKAIGDCAFYRSGVTDFVFESIQAPTLEYVYDAGVTQYIAETLLAEGQAYGVNYRGYYYANFETCIVDYSAYGKLESQLTVHRPTNGVGYENHVYATYFAKTVETGVKMDDTTRAALTLIDEMPDSEELASWLTWDPADAEKRAAVEELSAKAKQARAYVERVLLDEVQSSYLGTQPIEKLEAVETQLRRIKAHFGIAVKVYRLTYDPTSYKKEYKAGETFDMTGLKITVEYDDGSKEEADLSKMTLVTGPLTLNNRTVTLTGYGMEIGILVSVTEGDVTPDTLVEEKGGCGSLVGVPVCGLAVLAVAMVIRKKRKENYV